MGDGADDRVFIHSVDASGRILAVNDEWVQFALENGAPQLARSAVAGRALWDFIEDKETRHLSRLLLEKARRSGKAITLPYRCDSPDFKRYMEMEIVPVEGGAVEFRSRALRIEKRVPVALIDIDAPRSSGFLTICSWCTRARTERGWVELDEAVRALGLFSMAALPQITHGMCADCGKLILAKVKGSSAI